MIAPNATISSRRERCSGPDSIREGCRGTAVIPSARHLGAVAQTTASYRSYTDRRGFPDGILGLPASQQVGTVLRPVGAHPLASGSLGAIVLVDPLPALPRSEAAPLPPSSRRHASRGWIDCGRGRHRAQPSSSI